MIRQYFDRNCINIKQWALAHKLDIRTTYFVISGQLKGNIKSNGKTKKVFEALLEENIIKELPDGLKEDKAS